MPHFTSLSQAIRYHIGQTATHVPQAGRGTLLGAQTGQSQPPALSRLPEAGVQRWGFSTWGVEPITGVYSPEDEAAPSAG